MSIRPFATIAELRALLDQKKISAGQVKEFYLRRFQAFDDQIGSALEIFDEAGIENLREKSEALTGFLEFIIEEYNQKNPKQALKIITPKNIDERGCQLSLIAVAEGKAIFNRLTNAGVVCDWREPNVIRMAPVPLYNSFEDVFSVGEILKSL